MANHIWVVANEADMVALGEAFGRVLAQHPQAATLYFNGDLGAGKTTLCRGILRAFGHRGAVKSPTYTLVEPYEFGERTLYHFDLYRLGNAEELEYMGIRDYTTGAAICLFEWSERGTGFIPKADWVIDVNTDGAGRKVTVTAQSPVGEVLLQRVQ